MRSCEVAIVGAGLAGLYTAWAMQNEGVDVLVVEARDRVGGRVLSADAAGNPSDDGFDLGPSWFWPQMQPAISELVGQLGLQSFIQYGAGDALYERSAGGNAQRFPAMRQEPPSMRLEGGTGAAVHALTQRLVPETVLLGVKVEAMTLTDDGVSLRLSTTTGREDIIEARHVVAALPPRLLEASVVFQPSQEIATRQLWRDTPTWMAPHAKFFAIYDRPFWRETGLSGAAQSMIGPMVEIHDATTASGKAALFGFVGVGADHRRAAGEEALKTACLVQLERLFGPAARNTVATLLKDWAADPLTATSTDLRAAGHPVVRADSWVLGQWQTRLSLAGSETSPTEPGYLSGAITAAQRAVTRYLAGRDSR